MTQDLVDSIGQDVMLGQGFMRLCLGSVDALTERFHYSPAWARYGCKDFRVSVPCKMSVPTESQHATVSSILCTDYHESLNDLLGGPVAISICDTEQAVVMAGPSAAPGFPQGPYPSRADYQQQRQNQAHRNAQDYREATRVRQSAIASTSARQGMAIEPIGVVYSLADLRRTGMLQDSLLLQTSPTLVPPTVTEPRSEGPTIAAPMKHVTFQEHLPYSVPVHWQITEGALNTEAAVTTEYRPGHAPRNSILKSSSASPKASVTFASSAHTAEKTKPPGRSRQHRWQPAAAAKVAAAAAKVALLPTTTAHTQVPTDTIA
jgi:hypothetical protein